MAEATTRFSTRKDCAKRPGIILDPRGRWQFCYDPQQVPLISSQRKLVYRGTLSDPARRKPIAARALAFSKSATVVFGRECANLGRLASLGVGPTLLAVTQHDFEHAGTPSPTIIEEDAGVSLATLLCDKAAQRGDTPILHPAGTPERTLENLKILFDVLAQVKNAHTSGIYHRDLRCENLCVRRFGEAPADIKATLIDFDLATILSGGEPSARAPLFATLFAEIPSRVLGRTVSASPNPLELDMAYLAALQYHLERDGLLLNGTSHAPEEIDEFVAYLSEHEHLGYFAYRGTAHPLQARHLDTARDIAWIAERLGLTPVNERAFPSRQLLTHALSFQRPYLDREDMERCMSSPEARIAEMVDKLAVAKYETYKELRRAQGLDVLYERYEDQPLDLQRSTYAQVDHIPEKVRALGYLIAVRGDGGPYEEVLALSDEQIEELARLEHERWVNERIEQGWTLDRSATKGNPETRTTPYLVPYDELSNEIREYDRDAARQLIPLVTRAGLMVVRPV